MARRRTKSRPPARTGNPRRRRRRRSSSRRRTTRRRRRNPGFDIIGTLIAVAAGAAVGGAAYALEGAALSPPTNAIVLGAGGAVAGMAIGSLHKGAGAGVAGAGAGLAALGLLRHFMETKATEAQTSALYNYPRSSWRQMGQMGAVQGYLPYSGQAATLRGMGAVRAYVPGRRVTMS